MNLSGNKEENNIKSIYALSNKYGYKYNINHPFINDLYTRYLKWKGIPYNHPISDKQRADFENYVDSLFKNEDKDGYITIS